MVNATIAGAFWSADVRAQWPCKPPMSTKHAPSLFIVSDGRGETGASVLEAALVQFQGEPHHILREANVRTKERVVEIIAAAREVHGVVFYTLVEQQTRRALQESAAQHGVPVVDILGPVFSALHDTFGRKPGSQPGLLYARGRERFDRLDAVDYTLEHDDGCRHNQLGNADVVLVGVSRSGKSSTCFFLALQGVKAANVPFVPGRALPPELIALPKERLIGLVVNPNRLIALRQARAKHFGLDAGNAYTDAEKVRQEARDAHRLCLLHDWRTIDVSYMAVEEIAREVMHLCGLPERSLGY